MENVWSKNASVVKLCQQKLTSDKPISTGSSQMLSRSISPN